MVYFWEQTGRRKIVLQCLITSQYTIEAVVEIAHSFTLHDLIPVE